MTTDGRRDPRQPIMLEIRFKSATVTEFLDRHSRDISRGGIFIEMVSPLPSGTLIKFDLRLDEEGSIIQGVGRVVWRRTEATGPNAPTGMGVKFIKLDDTSRSNLGTILDNKTDYDGATDGVTGEAPVVEEQVSEPSQEPQLLEPVRPDSVSKDAKRTMIGMGSMAPPSNVEPTKEEVEDGSVSAGEQEAAAAADGTDDVDKGEITENTLPLFDDSTDNVDAGEVEEEAATETEEAATETEEAATETEEAATETEEAGEAATEAEQASDTPSSVPRETDILADISSAIDSALDGQEGKPAADEAEPELEDGTAKERQPDAEKTTEQDDTRRYQKPAVIEDKEKDQKKEQPKPVVSTRAGVKPESSSMPFAAVVVAVLVLGFLGWYFLLRPQMVSESADPSEISQKEQKKEGAAPTEGLKEKGTGTQAPQEDVDKSAPQFATIEIGTKPQGAKILINGKLQEGTTPLSANGLSLGEEVEVKTQLFGYVSELEKIVPGEKSVNIDFELNPAKVVAKFDSEPKGGEVIIDGKTLGKTPLTITKKEFGPAFTYIVKKQGYEDFSANIKEANWEEKDGVFSTNIEITLNMPAESDEQAKAKAKEEAKLKEEAEAKEKAAAKAKAKEEAAAEAKEKAAAKAKEKAADRAKAKEEAAAKAKEKAADRAKAKEEAKAKAAARAKEKAADRAKAKEEAKAKAAARAKEKAADRAKAKEEAKAKAAAKAKEEPKPKPKPKPKEEAKPKPKPKEEKPSTGGIDENPF